MDEVWTNFTTPYKKMIGNAEFTGNPVFPGNVTHTIFTATIGSK
jgi:hypothetical protein